MSKAETGSSSKVRIPSLARVLAIAAGLLSFTPLAAVIAVRAQSTAIDPGVRAGAPMAGGFISGLTPDQTNVELSFSQTFVELNGVTKTETGNDGLGPRFNSNGCAQCHAQPAAGGTSAATNNFFSVYDDYGAINEIPFFESFTGPALDARFPQQLGNPSLPDNQDHALFTITGRADAGSCDIAQPDFASASQQNDMSFRVPLPVFGDGLIEIIQNKDILANQASVCATEATNGVCGTPSFAPDSSVNRFGWKAQNRSLLIFAGEAYSVEEGVSNDQFPNELDETPGCVVNGIPEDHADFNGLPPHRFPGDPERFALFARFMAPPTPAKLNGSTLNGKNQFNGIGCNLCHTDSFTTPKSAISALSNLTANAFSDLLLHHMGACLADGITQGVATGDMFRTPPLWGAGQRFFFLHDGRTTDIVQAVEDHFCTANGVYPASEANTVINRFNALSSKNQQDLINFLRSL
jgi:CxxC motif-containing protein (DUF1111 family)